VRAKKRLGQNFLVDRSYQERIITAARPLAGETIVEIGPGLGALTRLLLTSGARVVAVELDAELAQALSREFAGNANLRVVHADALEVDFVDLIPPSTTARVVANLPYYISTAIISHMIEARGSVSEMIVMLQREVVERIVASPGGKEYGYLSVIVQFYCQARRLFDVPPGAFKPSPKVYSSVMRLTVRKEPLVSVRSEKGFVQTTQIIFAHRRKTILNNLRASKLSLAPAWRDGTAIERTESESGVSLTRRAETLSIEEIGRLSDALHYYTQTS